MVRVGRVKWAPIRWVEGAATGEEASIPRAIRDGPSTRGKTDNLPCDRQGLAHFLCVIIFIISSYLTKLILLFSYQVSNFNMTENPFLFSVQNGKVAERKRDGRNTPMALSVTCALPFLVLLLYIAVLF